MSLTRMSISSQPSSRDRRINNELNIHMYTYIHTYAYVYTHTHTYDYIKKEKHHSGTAGKPSLFTYEKKGAHIV